MTDTNLLDFPLLLTAIQRPSLSTPQRPFQSLQKPAANRNGIQHLLDDYSQRVNVINARRYRSEACLLTLYGGMFFYSIQYDLEDAFGDCG